MRNGTQPLLKSIRLGGHAREILADRSGAALFMVTWLLALLTVIVGQFGFSMRTEVNATRQYQEAAEAYYIAEAGVSQAILELLQKEFTATDSDDASEFENEDETEWRVNVPLPAVPFAGGAYRVYIDNESGRIDLNHAERGVLQMLVEHFELREDEKDTIVDAILDWRDGDELHRLNGAESDYYMNLPQPYRSKNGPFDSVSELLLVRGVTPEIYFGGLEAMVTASPEAAPQTVPSGSRGAIARAGNGASVNVNAARPEMLAALPKMTEDAVRDILAFREQEDFRSLDELAHVVGAEIFEAIGPFVTLEMSPYYIIHAEGRVAGSRVRQLVSARVRVDPRAATPFVLVERRLN